MYDFEANADCSQMSQAPKKYCTVGLFFVEFSGVTKCILNMTMYNACCKIYGSCVLKASVDRVSVATIGRYGDRHSADISTDTRPICWPSVGRVSANMLF